VQTGDHMNVNTLIVVADSARARLFRIATTTAPRAPFVLRETESLVHPEARIKERDRHTGSVAVAHSGKGGQGGHSLDDNRGAHEAEERRRFAKAVSHSVARSVMEHDHPVVVVLATHALHALLDGELGRELPKEVRVRSELGELSDVSPSDLLEELERRGLLQE
jgi:protein required for attachment to host cells